ncbi:hypothetical protein [Labrys sp. 22185]|uniref:hypothetical protein n=1 Tax=Labrys sp. 22185 TaxID=3453888 RepID=UPI003F834CF5
MFSKETNKADLQKLTDEIQFLKQKIEDLEREKADGWRIGYGARNLAETIAFKGDHENNLYKAFVGTEMPEFSPPRSIGLTSALCHQRHFLLDQYRFWVKALKDKPRFLRKQWEYVYIAQVLYERGMLSPGKRGLGFGVGQEPLPSLFASFGAEVVATDQSLQSALDAGWVSTHQHIVDTSVLNERGICTDKMMRELVSFSEVDMNAIDSKFFGQFDFCWSSCSLEHLGSLQHGLDFIENSLLTLKPGGVAVHTTEFNLTSNDATVESASISIYRKRDISSLVERLIMRGFKTSHVDFDVENAGYAEQVVDLPPYGRGEPHIRLRLGDFDATSICLVVEVPR